MTTIDDGKLLDTELPYLELQLCELNNFAASDHTGNKTKYVQWDYNALVIRDSFMKV